MAGETARVDAIGICPLGGARPRRRLRRQGSGFSARSLGQGRERIGQAALFVWSFSEYLNLIDLRSQTWCLLNLSKTGGFRIPRSDGVLFYAVLEGTVSFSCASRGRETLQTGDIIFVLSGEAHAILNRGGCSFETLSFLHNSEYVDTPITFDVGVGPAASRLLAGRLKPRWPGSSRPSGLPNVLRMPASAPLGNLSEIIEMSRSSGCVGVLTKFALLTFIMSLQSGKEGRDLFRGTSSKGPIARAVQFLEMHPFTNWTVGSLARKVGMARTSLATRFAAEVGTTPIAYVTSVRMERAAEMLVHTELKISEVAERVGYRSESAFSRRFNTHFGMTPGEMRVRAPAPLSQPERGAALLDAGRSPAQGLQSHRSSIAPKP